MSLMEMIEQGVESGSLGKVPADPNRQGMADGF